MAGAAARHRQGHHAAARGDLAGDAPGGRASRCPSACGRTASCCFGGERFSKSSGVRLDLDEAIDRYGADAFRYFLLREVPFDADGSFSCERFDERYNADLANALGNLASRAISMVEKYCDSVVPAGARRRARSRRRRRSRRVSRGDGREPRLLAARRRSSA